MKQADDYWTLGTDGQTLLRNGKSVGRVDEPVWARELIHAANGRMCVRCRGSGVQWGNGDMDDCGEPGCPFRSGGPGLPR